MSGEKILIADGFVSEAITLKKMLRSCEYAAGNPIIELNDVIQESVTTKPDLVIMDVKIGNQKSVLDAASKIITSFHIPILFLAGDDDDEIVQEIVKLGNPPIVFKPYLPENLVKSVDQTLKKHAAEMSKLRTIEEANVDPIATYLNSIPAPTITVNKRGVITRANKDMEFLTGYSQKVLTTKKLASILGTLDEDQTEEESVLIWPEKVVLKKADGTTQHVTMTCGFNTAYGDTIEDQIYVFKKVTGEVTFESKDIDVIFSKVLNSLDDLVFVLNDKMEVTHYNQKFFAFAKRLKISEYQLTRPLYEISQFGKIASVTMYEELFKTKTEMKHQRRYGSEKEALYMTFRFIPIIDDSGKATHMITIMRDVTDMETSRQRAALISEQFSQNRGLLQSIDDAMGGFRSTLYPCVKFVEKNPSMVKDPALKKLADMIHLAEKKFLVFDRAWNNYSNQVSMMQMNAKMGASMKSIDKAVASKPGQKPAAGAKPAAKPSAPAKK